LTITRMTENSDGVGREAKGGGGEPLSLLCVVTAGATYSIV
jgi:hypothetical protein